MSFFWSKHSHGFQIRARHFGQSILWAGIGVGGGGGGLDTLIHTDLKCKLMNFTRPMCMLKPYFKDQISDL